MKQKVKDLIYELIDEGVIDSVSTIKIDHTKLDSKISKWFEGK